MRLRTGAVLAAVACLVLAAAATGAVPKPTAGRCAMALSVFLRPAGRIDVFQYREIGGECAEHLHPARDRECTRGIRKRSLRPGQAADAAYAPAWTRRAVAAHH
jgi:hypothetical protein